MWAVSKGCKVGSDVPQLHASGACVSSVYAIAESRGSALFSSQWLQRFQDLSSVLGVAVPKLTVSSFGSILGGWCLQPTMVFSKCYVLECSVQGG